MIHLYKDSSAVRHVMHAEAARLLAEENHIVILGLAEFQQHRAFVAAVSEVLPQGLCIFQTQAEFRRRAGRDECLVLPAVTNGDPGYLFAFVPERSESRLALAVLTTRFAGLEALRNLIKKSVRAPIIALGGPNGITKQIEDRYAVVLKALRMIGEGNVRDITAN